MTRPHPYHPPLPQPAALIRVDTCDTRSHTFRETRTATAQHLRGRRWLHYNAPKFSDSEIKPTMHPTHISHSRPYSTVPGWQTFKYGKLGEVTENIRTFALPFESKTYTFKMQYEYDSWNRIQTMTYPDGEVVTYGYNQGGMLKSVVGNKNGVFSDYIKEIHYNKYELKDTVSYGNGTGVRYMYDSLLRLSHLRSACADGTMQDIVYTYDSVSNITGITNSAGLLPNGLGGPYYNHYAYDDLCRLILAEGEWNGNSSLRHGTYMRYEQNGRLSRKIQIADTWLDGNPATVAYDNCYHYEEPQPNTLTRIVEGENHREMLEELGAQIEQIPDKLPSFTQMFEWDATGNMVYHSRDGNSFGRQLCWDEQNRLLGVKDNGYLSYYQYDANGDRTYKLTGEYAAQNRSGQWHYYYLLNSPTLYASPYLVTDKKGYTKHYYAESERIASRIGGGGLHDLHKGFEEYPELAAIHNESSANLFGKVMECLVADALPQEDALQYLYDWQEFVEEEKECYWYHPDHLGSSSWITYSDGKAVQHLHYLPWGEDFVDQRQNSFDGARYTFSAKEKDSETGLSYFGSRYYSSDLSIWLSVDPMSGKYPSTSPYAYCRNNPLILYDPNGMFDDWVMDKYGVIYWDENAKDQSTTKFGEQYLGRAGQRSYGTAVVNYKSNGTWSFMNPVEIFSDNVTPVNVTANASSVMDDVADWICGNEKYLNGIAFCTGAGGGMVNQAFETSETIGRTADELLSARAMGKVAKTAKCFGFAGEAINIVVAFSNYTKDPTGYNFAKLIVTSTAAFSNCLNAVVPGLGTAVSIGISIIDVNGGFDWLYNKFK